LTVNIKFISDRLKQARTLQSLSVETVSVETGIESSRLNQIESGNETPSGDELLILANYYRHDYRDFLPGDRPGPFEQADILYRRHGVAFTAQDRRSIQEFLFLCEIEASLEKELKIPKVDFNFAIKGDYYKKHGEAAAAALRIKLGYKSREIPLDIYRDFRQIGVHIFRRKLSSSEISGLYIEHPTAGHCVLINYEEDVYRQRFSVSHEAAHAIFDSSDAVSVSYQRESSKYDRTDKLEWRANRFASCYLMPPDSLPNSSQWDTKLAAAWASRLNVSTAALSYALLEADYVNEATAKLIRSVSVPQTDKVDPEAPRGLSTLQIKRRKNMMERGLSNYYVGLCFDAHQQGIISAGRLAEALLTDHEDMREISVLYGRNISHEL